jgi:hypothetical protein
MFHNWFASRRKGESRHSVTRVLLIAAVMFLAQTAAAAHEFKHALHEHDDPLCLLHVYAAHHGSTPATPLALLITVFIFYPVELPLISFYARVPRYFIPHSQAPPEAYFPA